VLESGKLCEAAICYTGDLFNASRPKYDLAYYVKLARELERLALNHRREGHGRRDEAFAGEEALYRASRRNRRADPFSYANDTSGLAAATVLAAVEAGVTLLDARWIAFGTHLPALLGSLVAALDQTDARSDLDLDAIRRIRLLGGGPLPVCGVRERPPLRRIGGLPARDAGRQFTNLKEQARSLGLESRWHEVASAYAEANQLFGDIVKVTPSSKVVGDMALMMVTQDLSAAMSRPGPRHRLPRFRRADDEGRARPAARRTGQRRSSGRC